MFITPLSKVHRTFFSYKAKVAIEAIKEQKTISEIAVEYKVSLSLISAWKAEFLENVSQAFMKTGNQSRETDKLKHENEKLLKKVGQLTLEVDFFALKYPLEISPKFTPCLI